MVNLALDFTKRDAKYYIYSKLAVYEDKFLIECDSRSDTDNLIHRLINKQLPLPTDLNTEKYYELPLFIGATPVYRVKKRPDLR